MTLRILTAFSWIAAALALVAGFPRAAGVFMFGVLIFGARYVLDLEERVRTAENGVDDASWRPLESDADRRAGKDGAA
jgi:hypothetical protein